MAGAWQGRSTGGIAVVAVASAIVRVARLPGVLLLAPFAGWIALAAHGPARKALDGYWRRQRPRWSGDRRLAVSSAHLAAWLRVLADRQLAYLTPCPLVFAFERHGAAHLRAAVARGGCILLSAHLGNWELAGRLLSRLTARPVHLVLVPGEDRAVQQLLTRLMGDRAPAIIDPRDGPGAALAIGGALAAGDIVCMLGDRLLPGQPWRGGAVLGAPLPLPTGPFLAAAATGAEVLACFLVKDGRRGYRLEVSPPWRAPPGRAARATAVAGGVTWWAAQLDRQVRAHPAQWHNFFDAWRTPC